MGDVTPTPYGLFVPLAGLVAYLYLAFCLFKIAQRTGHGSIAWMCWIPVLNLYPFVKSGQRPGWWVILFFIPFINVFIGVLVFIGIFRSLGRSPWLSALLFVPIVNIALPMYAAFCAPKAD